MNESAKNDGVAAGQGLVVPRAAACSPDFQEWRVDEACSTGAETILLVEDQAFVRDVTTEVLRSAGYRVLGARNAAEATGAYEQSGDVDLLVTDVILPGESGKALAKRLHRQNPRLKILLITGYPEQMAPRNLESRELLAKPFSTGALLRKVRQLLDCDP